MVASVRPSEGLNPFEVSDILKADKGGNLGKTYSSAVRQAEFWNNYIPSKIFRLIFGNSCLFCGGEDSSIIQSFIGPRPCRPILYKWRTGVVGCTF
jgi:hypothetical protein